LRLTLHNPGADAQPWVLVDDTAWIDSMTVFVTAPIPWQQEVGDRLPFSSRALPSPLPAIMHSIAPGETQQVFVRLRSVSGDDMRLTLRLYQPAAFMAALQTYTAIYTTHLGVYITLGAIWLLFGIVLRQPTFITYAAFVTCTGFAWFNLRGLLAQHLAPDTSFWTNEGLGLLVSGALCLSFLFTRKALRLNSVAPILDRVALGLRWRMPWLRSCVRCAHCLSIHFSHVPLLQRHRDYQCVLCFCQLEAWYTACNLAADWLGDLRSQCAQRHLGLVRYQGRASGNQHDRTDDDDSECRADRSPMLRHLALWIRTQQQERLAAEHSANTDGLTGLNNRKCVERRLDELIKQPSTPDTLWLGIVDIDFFKTVNDTYGHAAGDAVLRSFAKILRANSRQTDIVGRFGGEEFVLVLERIDREGAERMTNHLREAFEATPTEFEGQIIPHTLSLGLAAHAGETDSQRWFNRADAALYEAKHCGRNRVCIAGG
jgi:diguanylate cyclase (GGDEF)-like protein